MLPNGGLMTEEEVEKRAFEFIQSRYGNIPYPGKPVPEGKIWNIPIYVRYPRILFDEQKKVPRKVRFLKQKKVGEIHISLENGKLLKYPRYYDLKSRLTSYLENIRITVEKALVKVGAENFSKLPFPVHRHTPIVDILSWLLVEDRFDLNVDMENLSEIDKEKYLRHIDALYRVGLIDIENNIVFPGNYLIEIESSGGNLSDKLSNALTVFFSRGYELIDSVRAVLGSHLIICGILYEASLQYDETVILSTNSVEQAFFDLPEYRIEKTRRLKIPRYLAQLESVKLIEDDTLDGNIVWYANKEILKNLASEEELIYPLMEEIR